MSTRAQFRLQNIKKAVDASRESNKQHQLTPLALIPDGTQKITSPNSQQIKEPASDLSNPVVNVADLNEALDTFSIDYEENSDSASS